MNEEPRACSYCGKPPQGNNWHTYGKNTKDEMRYFCATVGCPNALKKALTLDEWNTRPIEDALRAAASSAQAEVEELKEIIYKVIAYCASGRVVRLGEIEAFTPEINVEDVKKWQKAIEGGEK